MAGEGYWPRSKRRGLNWRGKRKQLSDNVRNVWIIGYPVVAYTSNGGRDTLSEDERLAIQYGLSGFLGEELR